MHFEKGYKPYIELSRTPYKHNNPRRFFAQQRIARSSKAYC